MKILVIGSGSVGLGLSAFLIKSSNSVTLFAQTQTKTSLIKNGFNVSGIFGDFKYLPNDFNVIDNYNDIDGDFDYILITAKTLANREIANNLNKIKNKIGNAKIVVIQNGWGNSEIYTEHFAEESVFTARIITGFFRESPSTINITVHADTMFLGNIFKKELSHKVKDLAETFKKGGFDAEISQDVSKHLWAKMLYNCALNPLGAILNVEYGKLAEMEHSKNLMNGIIDETYKAMSLENHSTFWKNDEYKELFYEKLIPSTYSHKSSMLQDLNNKRKTEIDSLNGIVVEIGKKHNINLPNNNFIVNIIKSKEQLAII